MTQRTTPAIPATWAEYTWPEWVPLAVRAQIESFWSEAYGRGPEAWARDNAIQGMPATGDTVTVEDIFSRARDEHGLRPNVTGRYIHAWNNMGRLLLDDGTVKVVSPPYRAPERRA